jgi:c-di-GMP-binding flagellar brake protein YcgR
VFPGGAQVDCHTRDLSETGVRLEFERPTPLPDRFDVEIENPFGPPVRARGVSVWRAIDDANRLEVGFELLDVSAADRLAIIRLMFSDPNAWMVAERPPDSIPRSLWLVVTSFFTARRERKIVSRAAPRLQVVMSCRLTAKGQTHEATTENLSELGALLRFEGRLPLLPPYAELALHVTDGHVVRCEAHIVRRHYSGGETLVAVRFHRMTFAQRRELGHFLYRGFGGEPVREARAETVDERRAAGRRAAIFSRVAPPPIAVPSPGTAGPRLIRRVEPPR